MKVVSWNINGLISWLDSQSYTPIEEIEPDVICLQETKTKRRLTAFSGYCHYWNPCERDGYHGTLTATLKEPLDVIYGLGNKEIDVEGRVLTVECPTVYVVNCYAPRAESLERHHFRLQWDEALQSFIRELMKKGKPIILCGDFNVVRLAIDVYPENEREHYALQGLASDERSNVEKLLEMGFVDAYRQFYPEQRDTYTWWSNRKHKRQENRGWRLDYFFVSSQASASLRDVRHLVDIQGSDHAPILLEIEALFTDEELMEDWKQTDWIHAEDVLQQYQKELTHAVRRRDRAAVWKVQQAIVNHPLIKRLAVRHVSQIPNTVGIDHVRWVTAADKYRAAQRLNHRPYKASPLRQIVIVDKRNGKERRVGIPTMYDRAMHKLYSYALSPVMEATNEPLSFGFRKNRSSFDVHENIKYALTVPDAPEYLVRTDIKAFYANVQHQWLVKHVWMETDILREFLNAGHIFCGELVPSDGYGISEGSSLSPILANIILCGLQKHAYQALGLWRRKGDFDSSNGRMIRYADDVLFTVRTEHDAKKIIAAMKDFLKCRGLSLSPEKTFIMKRGDKFTFLSRTYWLERGIFHSCPSEDAVNRFLAELEESVERSDNKSQRELIRLLNRKLKGWATYHRITEAEDAFRKIDVALQAILLKKALAKHPKMQEKKVVDKYWYQDERGRHIFALPDEKGVRLHSLADIPLIHYSSIHTTMNPYVDIGYFEARTHEKAIQHVTAPYRPIWERQGGMCFYCRRPIRPDQKKGLVEIDLRHPLSLGNAAYIHELCRKNEIEYIGCTHNLADFREMDIMRLLEEVSRIKDHRKHHKLNYLREKWRKGDIKWTHILLKRFFEISIKKRITLTFKQIEEIEGRKLHPASKTAAFWSEQKKRSYKSIADTWLSEGYELEELDLTNEKLTVRRVEPQSLLQIPEELTKRKLPNDAVFELVTYFEYIIKKYGLRAD